MDLSVLQLPVAKITQFNNKNIWSIDDLVNWLPKKYNDFREPKTCEEIENNELVSIIGKCVNVYVGETVTKRPMVTFKLRDTSGHLFLVRYFNASFMADKLSYGDDVIFCGSAQVEYKGSNKLITIINPIAYSKDIESLKKIIPVYRKVPGMSNEYFNKCLNQALYLCNRNEYLELDILKKFNLIDYSKMADYIHHPNTPEEIKKAKKRLIFDDLFFFNLMLKEKYQNQNTDSIVKFKTNALAKKYVNEILPFDLTTGQREAVNRIIRRGCSDKRINVLLQGDVGYGKTEVAKIVSLLTVENGGQVVILAPTNVLAIQHYNDVVKSFEGLNIKIDFLCGTTKKSERKRILNRIKTGETSILVGTHACLSDEIEYKKLGMLIIDEEHKFGVRQREKLNNKTKNGIHYISMSATPIPRSLALAMFGDEIDIIDIKTAPSFKKEIITEIVKNENDVLLNIEQTIRNGNQCYVVCPLIEETDSEIMSDVVSVDETYDKYNNYFKNKNIKVGMINGKMKEEEINEVLNNFYSNNIQVLISTTIIEVGVNVPNATLIVIKNAERFGLAQLHQLRGRVGRGKIQSYCLLQTNKEDNESIHRLKILCQSNDGFHISQEDMKLRGVGDFIGTAQTGENKYINLMIKFADYNKQIKSLVDDIYKDSMRIAYYEDRLQKKINDKNNE